MTTRSYRNLLKAGGAAGFYVAASMLVRLRTGSGSLVHLARNCSLSGQPRGAGVKPRRVVRVAAALVLMAALAGCGSRPDSVSGASLRMSAELTQGSVILPGRPVIVTPSERGGAERLASAMAARLGACVVSPADVTVEELGRASLLGLGSGIFDQAHHKALLELAERLPALPGRKVFIFSTSGVSRQKAPGLGEEDPHKALRERLIARGCEIVGEFNCVGYNDNSFLFLIGGINRGRPNAKDIALAETFADSLSQGGGI